MPLKSFSGVFTSCLRLTHSAVRGFLTLIVVRALGQPSCMPGDMASFHFSGSSAGVLRGQEQFMDFAQNVQRLMLSEPIILHYQERALD